MEKGEVRGGGGIYRPDEEAEIGGGKRGDAARNTTMKTEKDNDAVKIAA